MTKFKNQIETFTNLNEKKRWTEVIQGLTAWGGQGKVQVFRKVHVLQVPQHGNLSHNQERRLRTGSWAVRHPVN